MNEVHAVIELKITPQRESGFGKIAERISRFEQVEACFLMSGAYDLLVFVKGDSLQDVAEFVAQDLSTIEGVLSTATHFMLKTYKAGGVLGALEDGRMEVSYDGGRSRAEGPELRKSRTSGARDGSLRPCRRDADGGGLRGAGHP